MLSITTRDNASTVLRNFIYGINALGQRQTISREDNSVLTFGYDARRQVTSGQKTTAGSSFPAFDYRYTFDEIGNRKTAGPTAQPNNITYTANPLNQYTVITQAALTVNPTVDLNGSTLNDGRNVYTWDQRNQLATTTQTSTGEKIVARYDAAGRRTEAAEFSSSNSLLRTTRYLYDGWNSVAEFSYSALPTPTLTRLKTHTWGLDLSGSAQGAGGVGGLLATVDETATKAIYYLTYDGNGNVAALYTPTFSQAAAYKYDPFGNTISVTGPYATENKYRFSTKPINRIGGLYYYGYRYYNTLTGRWPSRDPIEENGGVNLYGMVGNDGINLVDKDGWQQFPSSVWGGPGGSFPYPTLPAPPFPSQTIPNFGVGVSVSVSAAIIAGGELSKSMFVTLDCQVCVTYTFTKYMFPSLEVVGSAGIGPIFGVCRPGATFQGTCQTEGVGGAAGWGPGGTGNLDWNVDGTGGGGGYPRVGPTFGAGLFQRNSTSWTGCAPLYYGPFAAITADKKAREYMGLSF